MRCWREEPPARGSEPPQVGIPGEHVARAAHAAERDHRLLRAPEGRHGRRAERRAARVRRHIFAAGSTCWRSSTTSSTCRRSRPARSRSTCSRRPACPLADSWWCWPRRRGSRIELVREPAPRRRRCSPTRRRLKQILYNLLSNAIKFTPPQGRVTLRERLADRSRAASAMPGFADGVRMPLPDNDSRPSWRSRSSTAAWAFAPKTRRPCSRLLLRSTTSSRGASKALAWAWRWCAAWPSCTAAPLR